MEETEIPALDTEPGWMPIAPFAGPPPTRSFVSGSPSRERLAVRYFVREADRVLVGKVWFGAWAEGPPGFVHGGAIAAVLDEAMGVAAWLNGHTAVAVQLVTEFRTFIPIESVALIDASIAGVEARKVRTRAALRDAAGNPYAEAQGLFLTLDPGRFGDDVGAFVRGSAAGETPRQRDTT